MDGGEKTTCVHYVCVFSNRKGGDREKGLQGRAGENGGIGGNSGNAVGIQPLHTKRG